MTDTILLKKKGVCVNHALGLPQPQRNVEAAIRNLVFMIKDEPPVSEVAE
jgi:hypothetical protein